MSALDDDVIGSELLADLREACLAEADIWCDVADRVDDR